MERKNSAALPASELSVSGQNDFRGLVTVVVIMTAAVAVVLTVFSGNIAHPVPLTLLSLLAVFGVFFLFALAAGHVHIGERIDDRTFAAGVLDQCDQAVQVTTVDGTPLWANSAFHKLISNATDQANVRSGGQAVGLKAFLGRSQSVSEALYRLTQAAEEGRFHTEVITSHREHLPKTSVDSAVDSDSAPHRVTYRVSVRTFVEQKNKNTRTFEFGRMVQWSIEDVSEDCATRNIAVAALKAQLKYYDALPIGVVAIDRDQSVLNMNATFTEWVGASDQQDENASRLDQLFSDGSVALLKRWIGQADNRSIATYIEFKDQSEQIVPGHVIGHWDAAASCFVLAITQQDDVIQALPYRLDPQTQTLPLFLKSAPFGIATIDRDGHILSSNEGFASLVVDPTDPEFEDATIGDLLKLNAGEDVRQQIEKSFELAQNGGEGIAPLEITVGAQREHTRRVYIQSLPRLAKAREAIAIYVIDVTEHKALEEKFAQSHKMEAVGKLAGGIAHDFNNVLTAIIGFSDLLLQTHRATDPAHKDIMNIKQSAQRAAGLVGKLLAFSRRQTFQTEVMHLGDSIADWKQFLERSIGEKVKLTIKPERDLWFVKSDRTQIEQVITNLSVNARDAMPDGGMLTIRMRNVPERDAQRLGSEGLPLGEYVLVEVGDTGCGISDEIKQEIFEPFFTTKPVGEGTGLGLSTVYGIVKQAGGFLFVDSEEGCGTTFRIYLPRFDDENYDHHAEKKKKKTVKAGDMTGTGRVLLVEDEDFVRSFAVRALTRQGYEVLEAASGVEALEVMEACDGEVDIVVSDVVMPEMDGPTLLKELRQTNPDMKIIFVSGYPNEAFKQALGEEEFAFLPKPFSFPELAAKVQEELAK